jgi:hypothetical protein
MTFPVGRCGDLRRDHRHRRHAMPFGSRCKEMFSHDIAHRHSGPAFAFLSVGDAFFP